MPHKRSKKKRQERTARNFIFSHSFRDYPIGETCNRVTWQQVETHLEVLYDKIVIEDWAVIAGDLVRGEVLSDSRGEGSFQKVKA